MDAFRNSLRNTGKKEVQTIIKKVLVPQVYIPKFDNLMICSKISRVDILYKKKVIENQICSKINKLEIIHKKKVIDNRMDKVNNFSILPTRKVLNSLGKHVYVRLKPLGRDKVFDI